MANDVGGAKVTVELDYAKFETDIAKVRALLRSLRDEPTKLKVEAYVDQTKLRSELERLRRQVRQFDASVKLSVDPDGVAAAGAAIEGLSRNRNVDLDVDLDGIAAAEARLDAVTRDRKAEIKVDVDKGGLGGLGEIGKLLRVQQGLGPLALSGSVGSIGSSLGAFAAPLAVLAGIGATLAGIAAAFGVVGTAAGNAAVDITKFAIQSAAELEVPLKSLARITGDQFEEIGAQVVDFARTTPFTVESAVKATQLAIAGIRIKPGEAVDFVSSIADAVAVGGGTTANFDNLTLALTKGAGRGKLQQREITQLVRNTRGLFRQDALFANIAEDLGISQGDVAKRAAEGALTFNESLGAIKRTLDEIPGAAGAAARATDTLAGAITNLQDNLQVASLSGFKGFLDSAKEALTGDPENGVGGISDALANQLSIIGPAVGRAFDDIGPRIAPAINKIGPLIANVVDSIGPSVVAIADAIGEIALGFSIGFGQGEFGGLPDLIRDIGTAIGLVGAIGRPVFNGLVEGLEAVAHAVQLTTGIITIQFATAFKAITEIVSGGLSLAADVTGAISSIPGANKLFDFGDAEKQLNDASRGINGFGDKVSQFSTGAIRGGLDGLKEDFGGIEQNIRNAGFALGQFQVLRNEGFGEQTEVFSVDKIKESLSAFSQTKESGTVAGQNFIAGMSDAIANSSGELTGEQLTAELDKIIADTVAAFDVATPAAEDFGAALADIGQAGKDGFASLEEAIASYVGSINAAAQQQQVVNLLAAGGLDQLALFIKGAPVESVGFLIEELARVGPTGAAAFEELLDGAQAGSAAIDDEREALETLKALAAAGITLPTAVQDEPLNVLEARLAGLRLEEATLIKIGADPTAAQAQIDQLVAEINLRKARVTVGAVFESSFGKALGLGGKKSYTFGGVFGNNRLGGGIEPGNFSWVGEGGRELIYTGTTAASVINNQTSERIASMLGLGAPAQLTAATPSIAAAVTSHASINTAALQLSNQQARLIGKSFAQTVGGVTAVIAPQYSDPEAIASKIRYTAKAGRNP